VRTLLPNPGGQLDPADVFGRDVLIKRVWRILGRQSVVITAERRMGKTCLIRKMMAGLPPRVSAVYQDLEQVHSTEAFADLVYRGVEPYLTTLRRTRDAARRALQAVEEAKAGPAGVSLDLPSLPWADRLRGLFADVGSRQDGTLVLFWDELPLMIDQIAKQESDRRAMEVLDLLRAMRHEHPALRMVYTGSIGLHHVVGRLKAAGYANEPTNDMHPLELPPLSPADAKQLAVALLTGAGAHVEGRAAVAEAVAMETDGIPFLIHYIVDLVRDQYRVDVPAIRSAVQSALTADEDPLNLHHYETRIADYYPASVRPVVMATLDCLATAVQPLKLPAILGLVKAQVRTEDAERHRELVRLLCRDHYLYMNRAAACSFRFSIIRRWWCLHRGLEA
jgi:hypothetical protein